MANGEAEKKNIAKLEFNIQGAISDLDSIDKKLKQISNNSETYFNKMSKNLKGSINIDNMFDTKNMESKLKNVTSLTEKQLNNLSERQIKKSQDVSAKQQIIDIEKNAKIEVAAIKHQNKLEEINQRQLKSTKTIYEKIAEYAKTYLIYTGFNELKRVTGELINEMVDVEYQMVQIDRVLNDSSLNINNYRDKLIQLAYDYGNSFDNVSDITLRLAQAGFDADESLALTEKTLLALNTAELNATQATSDMVAIMSQWGLMTGDARKEAEDYGNIIDKINKVADNFPTKSEDILNALKKTSSAFNLAGASIDETIAMITTAEIASQRGGKAIGTAMNSIIQQLKDTKRLTTMESLGIDIYTDATKTEFKSIIEIISQLSEKMQQLKQDGKENSVEMKNLLEVFTVFRRNVGAGLLGEMAGEDSTYAKVLETSINSIGYSLQENEKHMKTAKAAQEQFNATLLQLKTSVWDGGVEDVFRSMLLLGNDVINNIKFLVDTFGSVPTSIGIATLALTAFSKNMKVLSLNSETGKVEFSGFLKKIIDGTNEIKKANTQLKVMKDGQVALEGVVGKTGKSLNGTNQAAGKYITSLISATAKTIALEVATIALNAAISLGLSFAITGLLNLFDNLIHAQEKYLEGVDKEITKSKEKVDELTSEKETLDSLIDEYEKLSEKEGRTPEENQRIYEIQLKINQILDEQGKNVDLVNGKYEDQLKTLKEISLEQQRQIVEEKAKIREESYGKKIGVGANYLLDVGNVKQQQLMSAGISMAQVSKDILGTYVTGDYQDLTAIIQNMNWDEQLKYMTEWKEKLEAAKNEGKEVSQALEWVNESLETLNAQEKEATESTNDYYDSLAKLKISEWFPEDKIQNVEDYNKALYMINQMDFSSMDGFKEKLIDIIQNQFPQFVEQAKAADGTLEDANSTMTNSLTALQNLSDQYAMLRDAQDEYNKTGEMTISTLQGLIDNNLLQYLSIQNGQLQINAQSMLDLAEAKKVEAIEALQSAAANDLEKVAIGDVNNISVIAKGAIASVGDNSEVAGNQMETASGKAAKLAVELQAVADAASGNLGQGVDLNTYKQQAQAIINTYSSLAKNISAINIKTASYTPQTTRGSGSGSSSAAATQAKREAEQAAKAAEQAAKEAKEAEEKAYKERLEKFTDYIDEKERLEKRWVDKQKELGILSNKDYLYITQQRIERYKKYLEEVKKATWMKAEDRLELEKKYSEKIEDLQVDYIGYLKDQLEEEINALEDANNEKIKLIEEEADKRIEALRAVENENDRIRAKEEYLKKRQQHLDDISYWEQRTGREAQEALKEAKSNLKELDEEWQKQLEDWDISDQIEAIEEERDAQIKAIQDAQKAEIESMQSIYDAKVKMFAETGQIIYESSIIQSQNLYNAYKKNFIDPISADLANLNKVTTPAPTTTTTPQTPQQQYETYNIKWGDTLSGIAKKFGTTIEKIMAANPYVTNKNRIYAGKTLQIPKFHDGGIVGGNQEAFALLKPNEVILKPEWADGINKLAKMARNNENNITNNSTVIEVKGDLVKIDANIKNKTDAEFLTRRVEKILKDKFNIKK